VGSLLYRPDWAEARARLTRWWNGEHLGRAILQITAPRSEPIEHIEEMPRPEGVVCDQYTAKSTEFRVNRSRRGCIDKYWLGEAVPAAAPGDAGPGTLALFLGCEGVEMPGTVWFEPCVADPDSIVLEYDPDNSYWCSCQEAHRQTLAYSRGKFLHQFPDLTEGLDTLAAMRGAENLLMDLIERPEWVHRSLRRITDLYFHYYDILYDLIRDEVGGSIYWCWAPGRLTKLQCDFSAMISPAMFNEFMLPILREMTQRVSYSLYHWDGPGALPHLEALLSLAELDMIQWTPGAGQESSWHKRWWPMYHEILDAGKKLMIGADNRAQLLAIKQEFGEQSQGFFISMAVATLEEAEGCLRALEL